MAENIEVSAIIPARAERIYTAWLSGEEHGKMIGASATYEADDAFTAWDGYISGKTLEKQPHTRFVQSWRTTEFPDDAPDSRLAVSLEPTDGGTKVTLVHTNIPDGQGASYEEGWVDHYFEPMKAYFATPGSRLKEIGEVLEDAAERAEAAVEDAAEEVAEEVEARAKKALKAVDKARSKAKKQALKAVKTVQARARAVGKKVKAALARKKKPAGRKKAPAKKKAAARKKKKR